MAYLIFTFQGHEVDRRPLAGTMVIGRAPDCDMPLKDIVLSRKHCRVEPAGTGRWRVIDLGSKNGTFLNGQAITEHVLENDQELVIGRSAMRFRADEFAAAPARPAGERPPRPDDPEQALAGTVYGFELVLPDEVDRQPGAPVPQPQPRTPRSYVAEPVQSMLSQIVSSSWDSIHEMNARPLPTATVLGRTRRGISSSLAAGNGDAPRRRIRRPAMPPRPGREPRRPPRGLSLGAAALIVLIVSGWVVRQSTNGPATGQAMALAWEAPPLELSMASNVEVELAPQADAVQLLPEPLGPPRPPAAPPQDAWRRWVEQRTSAAQSPPPAATLLLARHLFF